MFREGVRAYGTWVLDLPVEYNQKLYLNVNQSLTPVNIPVTSASGHFIFLSFVCSRSEIYVYHHHITCKLGCIN